jgi:hypothetical protein
MSGWREKKRKALADVHKHFEVDVVHLTHATGTPVRMTVRVHRKQITERPPLGMSDLASMFDTADRIIFQKSQLPSVPEGVLSKSYIIVSNTEAYFSGASKPERDGYIWCEVTEVVQSELDALIAELDITDLVWEGILT